jgi:hypothetical protein
MSARRELRNPCARCAGNNARQSVTVACAAALQGLSPLWALSHFCVLLLCAMVGLAGMIVALVRFGNTITGLVMSTHQVLGLLSVGESHVTATAVALLDWLIDKVTWLSVMLHTATLVMRCVGGLWQLGGSMWRLGCYSWQSSAAPLAAVAAHDSQGTAMLLFNMHRAHDVRAGLSVVLVIMYGLRPFLVSGQKHKHMPSPLLGPQKIVGVITIAAGWASLFLGCVVIHQNWVSTCSCFAVVGNVHVSMKAAMASLLLLTWAVIVYFQTVCTSCCKKQAGMPVTPVGTTEPQLCSCCCDAACRLHPTSLGYCLAYC